jgi:hypothetical protein
VTVTLPQNLDAGDYLLRHELIALQNADSAGGVEFYPACTQIRIGSGSSDSSNSTSRRAAADVGETVKFPGGYSDSDPGIHTDGVYNPGFSYVMPGPPLSPFAVAGGSAITVALPTPAGSDSGDDSSSQKKRAVWSRHAQAQAAGAAKRPHRASRVMKALAPTL